MKMRDYFSIFFLMVLMAALIAVLSFGLGEKEAAAAMGENVLAAPVLSESGGFYEEPFWLTIEAPEGAKVYYTLDGSIPVASSLLYTGPIEITYGGSRETSETYVENMQKDWKNTGGESHANLATIVRAVSVYDGNQASSVVTATYFIDQGWCRDGLVLSLVADPKDLFGENGIYVTGKEYDDWYLGGQGEGEPVPNYLKHGKEWERPAVLEMFRGTSILQQPVGIRIQGASAREVSQKRFSVYARKEYSGSNWFEIPLFSEKRSHSFVLRSGFMNAYIQHLIQDRNVASAESKEVTVFLNGALWYVTMAQEKISEKYFQENYGVDDDNVIIAKAGSVEKAEDYSSYQAMYDFLSMHDMSVPEAYGQLNELMDIQSYIDFSCVNVYFGNLDYNENKNSMCWRVRKPGHGLYEDGRWRWVLYDMDLENLDYGVKMEEINTFTMDTHYAGPAFNTRPMYVALKQNPIFCRQFVLSFMDMVNTDFTVEKAQEALMDWDVNIAAWGIQQDWAQKFFPARTEAVTGYLAEEFGLKGQMGEVRLYINDRDAGIIKLNTIVPEMPDGEWIGRYFTDYPVSVSAVANRGYRFVGWESGDGAFIESETLQADIPDGGLELKAVFEKES